jgi:hypothetical protein
MRRKAGLTLERERGLGGRIKECEVDEGGEGGGRP